MAVTRRSVLVQLAQESDAKRQDTTTVEALAKSLDSEGETIEAHLAALQACELARVESDGAIRVTRTGEELLALAVDDVIIDPQPETSEP